MSFTVVASLDCAYRRIEALAGACRERVSLSCAFNLRSCSLRSLGSECVLAGALDVGAGYETARERLGGPRCSNAAPGNPRSSGFNRPRASS